MDGSQPTLEFEDFDDGDVFSRVEASIYHADTLNFVIDFDVDTAVAATNLSSDSVSKLLAVEHPPPKTRWINIWSPERQTATIKVTKRDKSSKILLKMWLQVLAKHYGFSPRLTALMCSEPDKPEYAGIQTHPNGMGVENQSPSETEVTSLESHSLDVEANEKGAKTTDDAGNIDLNHYSMVDEVWNYCSVDWGSKYLCAGYNSLSQLKADVSIDNEHEQQTSNKPRGRRLWTWLLQCRDSTIIAIHENPYPHVRGSLNAEQIESIGVMRRNLLNVFWNLSGSDEARKKISAVAVLPIRSGLQDIEGSEITASDAPSLLFYYLFDDWQSSYSLVAKQEHQYGKQLGYLRDHMSKKPEVKHVQNLHHIGQQLAVLKKIYKSYSLIIERILDRQKPVDMSNSTHLLQEELGSSKSLLTAQTQQFAVALSSAATVRFERLNDRINLYALSEIQDCLDEKDNLVFLNFNLITLKQSNAVERLTRITILLAKITILFMPVSLMTAYFSVQIDDLQHAYTSTTYWVAFAVIITLSFIFLLVFGAISGTVEGEAIYQSFTQIFLTMSRNKINARRAKNFSYRAGGDVPI